MPIDLSVSGPLGVSANQLKQDEEDIDRERSKDLEELLAELGALIGLDSVKKEVRSLVNLMRVRELRRQRGMAASEVEARLPKGFPRDPHSLRSSSWCLWPRYWRRWNDG